MEFILMKFQYRFLSKLLNIFPKISFLDNSMSMSFSHTSGFVKDADITEESEKEEALLNNIEEKVIVEQVQAGNDTMSVEENIPCEIYAPTSDIVTYVITDKFDTVLQTGVIDVEGVEYNSARVVLDGWKYDTGNSYNLTYGFYSKNDVDPVLSATRCRNRESDNRLEFIKV